MIWILYFEFNSQILHCVYVYFKYSEFDILFILLGLHSRDTLTGREYFSYCIIHTHSLQRTRHILLFNCNRRFGSFKYAYIGIKTFETSTRAAFCFVRIQLITLLVVMWCGGQFKKKKKNRKDAVSEGNTFVLCT